MTAKETILEWFKNEKQLHNVTKEQIFAYYDNELISISHLAGCIVQGLSYLDDGPSIYDIANESEEIEDFDTANFCDEIYNELDLMYRSYCNK